MRILADAEPDAEPIEEFHMDLYFKIVEEMTVFHGNKIIVSLLDGTEIEW